jgi:hypothetical protein
LNRRPPRKPFNHCALLSFLCFSSSVEEPGRHTAKSLVQSHAQGKDQASHLEK